MKESMFHESQIEYTYDKGHVILSCGGCKISFENNLTQSIWIKEGKEKTLQVNISSNQKSFMDIIQQNIDKESNNLKVLFYYQDQLLMSCNNCSESYQQQVILKFEEYTDLFNFSIQEHQYAEITFSISLFSNKQLETSQVLEQVKDRFTFSWKYNKCITLLSFRDENVCVKRNKFIKESIQKFEFDWNIQSHINNEFKINFFKEFIFPQLMKCTNNKPYEINFCLNLKQINFRYSFVKLKCRTTYKVERLKLEIDFSNRNDILNLIKYYFDSIQEDEEDIINIKFHLFPQYQFEVNQTQFHQDMAKIDTKCLVKKLTFRYYANSDIQQYRILQQMNNLKRITIYIPSSECLAQFLQLNQDYLNLNNKDTKLLSLQIYNSGYYYVNSNQNIQLEQCKHFNFTRINEILIYPSYQIMPQSLKNMFFHFKKLINLQIREYKQRINQKCVKSNYHHKFTSENNYYDYDYENWKILYYDKQDKIKIAYDNVEVHDDINCSYSRVAYCNCNNKEINKLLQKPAMYFYQKYSKYYY